MGVVMARRLSISLTNEDEPQQARTTWVEPPRIELQPQFQVRQGQFSEPLWVLKVLR
jgi:hypothetical protein